MPKMSSKKGFCEVQIFSANKIAEKYQQQIHIYTSPTSAISSKLVAFERLRITFWPPKTSSP
jgi:hypothetical protein